MVQNVFESQFFLKLIRAVIKKVLKKWGFLFEVLIELVVVNAFFHK